MVDPYKEIFQSSNKEKIINSFLSLIQEDKKSESIKFLYKLILYSIDDTSLISKNIKSLITQLKENYITNSKLKLFIEEYLVETLWIIGFSIYNPSNNQAQKNENEHDKIKAENYKNFINLVLGQHHRTAPLQDA